MRMGQIVTVAYQDETGAFNSRQFSGTLTDAEIKAELLGLPKPEKEKSKENSKIVSADKKKTIPDPPIVPRNRITRQDMISVLEKAGIKNYDPNNYGKLKAAYNELQQKGAK